MKKQIKKAPIISTEIDWGHIRNIFKNEYFYVRELLEDIITFIEDLPKEIIGADVPINVSIYLGIMPQGLKEYEDMAIQSIKKSFLLSLQTKNIIRNIKYERIYDDNAEDFFISASFVCNDVFDFKERAKKRISDYLIGSKEMHKYEFISPPKYEKNQIVWGNKKLNFRGGQAILIATLMKTPSIHRGKTIIDIGGSVDRKELEIETDFSEKTFRNAIKKLNRKMKLLGFPIKIKSIRRNQYIIDISLNGS